MNQILETERLLLRELGPEDAKDFYQLNEDPEVIQYTGDPPFANLEASRVFLEGYNEYERHGMGRWAVIRKEDQEWLGWCGLKNHADEGFVNLGFRLYRCYWGKGYATEAALGCIAYGFNTLGLNAIVGQAMKENLASIRVLEKCGMQRTGDKDCGGQPGVVMVISKDA